MGNLIARRHTRLFGLVIFMLASVGALGCGDDDDTGDDDTGSGGAGVSGSGGATAGTGGMGSGGTGSGGTGSGGMMAPVVCGGTMCTGGPAGSLLTPCCAAGACGLGTGAICQLKDAPGTLDPSCPSHMVTASMTTLAGCCKPDNQCGVMSMSGLGCIERTELATYAGGPLDAVACGGDLDGGELDSGP